MMLRPLVIAAALAFTGSAHAGLSMCDIDSDYDLAIKPHGLVFSRASGSPETIEFRSGQLRVDGTSLALGAADRERVLAFERGVRELVPEVQSLALAAVDLAFSAVSEVAMALVEPDNDRAVDILARMEQTRDRMRVELQGEFNSAHFDESLIEQQVEALVGELVPLITSEAAAVAIKVALSGDESAARKLEQRMQRMENDLEARVEGEAKAIEARADALCPQIARLDAIDDAFEVRLADNRPLDLLQYRDN